MIPKIKKILYATDLTQNSLYAFRYAINSAVQHDADVYMLHVLEIPFLPVFPPAEEGVGIFYEGPLYVEKMQTSVAAQRKMAKQKLQNKLQDFCREELRTHSDLLKHIALIEIVEGDPAGEILRKAAELPADLVIMGTHGKGLLAHAFLGSVAEKVLNRIKIPLFIIPLPEKADTRFGDVRKP